MTEVEEPAGPAAKDSRDLAHASGNSEVQATGSRRLWLFLSAVPSSVWAAALAVYLALRLLAVAGFNTTSALTILSDGGTGTAVVGTLVNLIPVLLVTLTVAGVVSLAAERASGRSSLVPIFFVSFGLLLMFFFSSWLYLGVAVRALVNALISSGGMGRERASSSAQDPNGQLRLIPKVITLHTS